MGNEVKNFYHKFMHPNDPYRWNHLYSGCKVN